MFRVLLLIIYIFVSSQANTNTELTFTKNEQEWIDKQIPITYVYDIDWTPFEWKNEVNRHTGIIPDILDLISQKSNVKFTPLHTSSWEKAVLLAQHNKVDMFSAIPYSEKRAQYMNFTKNDIFKYNPCFVKHTSDNTVYNDLKNTLVDKKVAIVKSSSLGNSVKKSYPQAEYIYVEKTIDGFIKLQNKEVDLFIINSATADYIINSKGYDSLKIAKKLDTFFSLKIAISKTMPLEVIQIIDKTLLSIDQKEIDEIYYKWTMSKKNIDWEIIIYTIVFSLLIIVFLIYRQYLLNKVNTKLEKLVYARTIDLENSKNELKEINVTLEERIIKEVEKNKIQYEQTFKQTRLVQMGEMISMIAHQWRQPLNAISTTLIDLKLQSELEKFNLENIQDAKKYENYVNKSLDDINDFVQNLTNTIEDFRDFYKPNKDYKTLSTNLIIDKSLKIVQGSLDKHNISLVKNYKSKIEMTLYEQEIMHVILNIIKNSQDNFIEKNTITPTIEINTYDLNEFTIIEICDNGGGIPEDILEFIYDPYFSTKKEKNGTGLGLYMSKIIVEEHHSGKLSEKNSDNGVCFTIRLGSIFKN